MVTPTKLETSYPRTLEPEFIAWTLTCINLETCPPLAMSYDNYETQEPKVDSEFHLLVFPPQLSLTINTPPTL
jgi:hypothetical protein